MGTRARRYGLVAALGLMAATCLLSGCATDGYGPRVGYHIGVGSGWHSSHWHIDRRPIYVGPPIDPGPPVPELPIEPPDFGDLIAVPY